MTSPEVLQTISDSVSDEDEFITEDIAEGDLFNALYQKRGFDRGLEPELIAGASNFDETLFLLIKWKGFNFYEPILAEEAHGKCPQLVIDYYQKIVRFD